MNDDNTSPMRSIQIAAGPMFAAMTKVRALTGEQYLSQFTFTYTSFGVSMKVPPNAGQHIVKMVMEEFQEAGWAPSVITDPISGGLIRVVFGLPGTPARVTAQPKPALVEPTELVNKFNEDFPEVRRMVEVLMPPPVFPMMSKMPTMDDVPDLPTRGTRSTDERCPSVDDQGRQCVFDSKPGHRFHNNQLPLNCEDCPNNLLGSGPARGCVCGPRVRRQVEDYQQQRREEGRLDKLAYALRAQIDNSNITPEQHHHLVEEVHNLLVTLEMFGSAEHQAAWLRKARSSIRF